MSLVSQALQATALSALSALASSDVVRRVHKWDVLGLSPTTSKLLNFLLFVVSALTKKEN